MNKVFLMVQPCKRREIISKSSWLVMRATDNRKRGQIWATESFGRSEQVEERGIKPKGMQDENLSQFSGAPEELQASQFEPFPLKPRNYFPDLSRIRNPENGRQTAQVSFHVTWTPYIHKPHFIPWGRERKFNLDIQNGIIGSAQQTTLHKQGDAKRRGRAYQAALNTVGLYHNVSLFHLLLHAGKSETDQTFKKRGSKQRNLKRTAATSSRIR